MRYFRFDGYTGNVYYGLGEFTKGKVYKTEEVQTYHRTDLKPDAKFTDDTGSLIWEEIHYFTEITNETQS